jgi:hypothetical protein
MITSDEDNGLSGESLDENLHTTTQMKNEVLEKESTIWRGTAFFIHSRLDQLIH